MTAYNNSTLRRGIAVAILTATAWCSVSFAQLAQAQSLEKIADISYRQPNLFHPVSGLVEGLDGSFYGVSEGSIGPHHNGALYKISSDGSITILHQFQAPVPQPVGPPYGTPAIGPDGAVYGCAGGENPTGIVYRYSEDLGYTRLFSFAPEDSHFRNATGGHPDGDMLHSKDGYFYGECGDGGANGDGTIFRISRQGAFQVVYTFSGSDGIDPWNGLVEDSAGNLYGVTQFGGATIGDCVLFKLTRDATSASGFDFSILHDFQNTVLWVKPLVVADGTVYGATYTGGTHGEGALYRVTADGTYSTFYSFIRGLSASGEHNGHPRGSLVMTPDGIIWATCAGRIFNNPGNANGAIVGVTKDGVQRVAWLLDTSHGINPLGGLCVGTDGNLYGACYYGGAFGKGTVFSILSP